MPKKYKLDYSSFNEEKLAEKILKLSFDISPTMNRLIQNETCAVYYNLLTKYLINKKIEYQDIKKIIRRHITLCLYNILVNKKNGIKKIDEMEVLLKNITISKLLEDEDKYCYNPFCELYRAETYKEIKKASLSILDEYCNDKWVEILLKIIYDYFKFDSAFADIKYINHSDLMISHSLFDDYKMNSFTFKSLKSFDSNWKIKNSNEDYKEVVLGHVINIIFENDNLDFNKTMNIKPMNYYKMMINESRKKSIEALYFMDVDIIAETAVINKNEIKQEFDFEYNNIVYKFTKNGIIKSIKA